MEQRAQKSGFSGIAAASGSPGILPSLAQDDILLGRMIQENNVESKGGGRTMAGRCEICERKPQYGSNVSHSKRHTNRRFVVNVQHKRLLINGTMQYVNICTRCLRTRNKVAKAR
jgi:large subunit ribosomal protein L28